VQIKLQGKCGVVGENRMEKIKLTDICNPKQWKTIPTSELLENGYPVYGANGIIGYYSEFNHKNPVITVTCRGATCGTINITVPKSYVTGNAMCLDDMRSDIYMEYLYYCLKHYNFNNVISGSAQPQITRQGMEKIYVTIGSHNEQMDIVDKLKKVENVIGLRKRELKQLDTLVKSRFAEMFGDPIRNPKGWKVVTIGDIVTEVRYGTSKPAVEGGKYPYLRMNNLTADGHLDLNDLKYIDISDDEVEKCVVRKGDVLFNRTNSIDLVGKTAVFDLQDDMVIAGYIIRVRLNEKILPEVLSQYMNLEALKDILRSMAKGAVNQANINAQELQSIRVYVPDIELQKQFVEMKDQVDKSKSKIQKSLEETQLLFDSLMQKYFG
jgi:type I restriction enzyme S subunit